ncbi:MAG: glycerol-3-phosphate responsive antiterminator [Peptostreptococcaceae bacterium]|nr:glycerol-3-phosphate responsive antiterminator [Peptostreptococcaceae bacterium]MDY5738965.1 glycerol-3-phosphate responsive antiterminator [Anaerovoracaceae bacterium]SFE35182.1 glycerol uptake operon antiterminator [Peptostreptococcaceae bacterium pGA-8]
MTVDFIKEPIAAAIRTDQDFSAALRSNVDMVFLLHSNIMTVKQCVKEIHSWGKKAFIHVDFAEGIGKDRYGLEFLAKQGVDGILTTRTNIVKTAKEFGLITVQRFFMVDSHSVGTSVDSIKISKPDIIEIMPGIVTKKIKEFSQIVEMPIIAGGIVETEEEVRAALEAGAAVVSTGEVNLWNFKL